jgi:hypothetical protein
MSYQVKNIDIDVYNFKNKQFCFDKTDIEVSSQYINSNNYNIIVRRLDSYQGWNEIIYVLVYYREREHSQIIEIGSSPEHEKIIQIITEFNIEKSEEHVYRSPLYNLVPFPQSIWIGRELFNDMFATDVVMLPTSMYAVGLSSHDGCVYIYNEIHNNYFMIDETIRHIIQVALTYTEHRHFYFVISAYDGYMEGHYNNVRTIPRKIQDTEYINKPVVVLENDNEYAVLHNKIYVIAQANHTGMPYVLDVVDRHYFYHNLYNPFRSYHRGIPFSKKENKIVFGGQDRGGKHNFVNRRDIEISQRDYLKSDAVPKDNIVCSGWIDRFDMVNYKYILDVDGNSATWDATAWKLNSGSVIFKTESNWRQWFHDEYLPNVHYIEIKDDFSNLQEKFHWCENHQEECEIMVNNCKALFQKTYKYINIMEYTKTIIDKIVL